MKIVIVALAALVLCEARSRRAAPEEKIKEKIKEVKDKFPTDEWESFWNKLEVVLGDQYGDFQGELMKNKGDMDLTLEQFKTKMETDYPIVRQQWVRAKSEYDKIMDKLDETTVRDIFNKIKAKAEECLGKEVTEKTVKDFVNYLKNFFITTWNKIDQA